MTLDVFEGIELPDDFVTQPCGVLARRGAGKTYTTLKIAEELVGAGLPLAVLATDPRHYRRRDRDRGRCPMTDVRALTLWQPWASLVAVGAKTIETRGWSTDYRGPLLIHAAKRKPDVGTAPLDVLLAWHNHDAQIRPLPLGAVGWRPADSRTAYRS